MEQTEIACTVGEQPNRPFKQMRRTSHDLTDAQHRLLQIFRIHQFGRIENLQVQHGEPVLNQRTKVVRVARLGAQRGETEVPVSDDFELKQSFRDLFAALARLQNGTILRLEFRHGLPWLLETDEAAAGSPGIRA